MNAATERHARALTHWTVEEDMRLARTIGEQAARDGITLDMIGPENAPFWRRVVEIMERSAKACRTQWLAMRRFSSEHVSAAESARTTELAAIATAKPQAPPEQLTIPLPAATAMLAFNNAPEARDILCALDAIGKLLRAQKEDSK